jgi:hypothetical protein
MEAMDLGFDSAAARVWKMNVDSEIAQVNQTLNEVGTICTDLPSNDSIMQSIGKAGNLMQERWNALTSTFNQICDITGQIINQIENGVNTITEIFNKMFGR